MGREIPYTDEFQQEAVSQKVLHGWQVSARAKRQGIANKSLYDWMKKYSKPKWQCDEESDLLAENARLKQELERRNRSAPSYRKP